MRKAPLCIAVLLLGCSTSGVSGNGGKPRPHETPREAAAQLNLPGGIQAPPGAAGASGGGTTAAPPGAAAPPAGPQLAPPPGQTGSGANSSTPAGSPILPGLSRMPGYQASLTVVDPGLSGSDSLARGYKLYQENCAVCHGSDLRGPETTNNTMPTRDLTLFKQYKYGGSDQALYRTLVYGIPRTAMGNFQSAFSPGQFWDIIHYLKSKRRD